jgi:hypothetical protein
VTLFFLASLVEVALPIVFDLGGFPRYGNLGRNGFVGALDVRERAMLTFVMWKKENNSVETGPETGLHQRKPGRNSFVALDVKREYAILTFVIRKQANNSVESGLDQRKSGRNSFVALDVRECAILTFVRKQEKAVETGKHHRYLPQNYPVKSHLLFPVKLAG